jgi:hypothetical protein
MPAFCTLDRSRREDPKDGLSPAEPPFQAAAADGLAATVADAVVVAPAARVEATVGTAAAEEGDAGLLASSAPVPVLPAAGVGTSPDWVAVAFGGAARGAQAATPSDHH